jgi:hypothetical protein
MENALILTNDALLKNVQKVASLNSWQSIDLRNGHATLTAVYNPKLAGEIALTMGSHTCSEPNENTYIKWSNYYLTIYLYIL